MTLIQLAVAFAATTIQQLLQRSSVRAPPSISTVISRLPMTLSEDVLDRIDEIVAPGITINPADNMSFGPNLTPAVFRGLRGEPSPQ